MSRRRLAAVVASLVLSAGLDLCPEADAKKKKGKKKKKPTGRQNGAVKCGGECIDTRTDANHCGGCGDACAAGITCSGGQCDEADDLACTSQAQCGGDNGDLRCQGNRCICTPNGKAGWGICQRFQDEAGLCGPCCPGATVANPCAGENDRVNQTMQGCGCEAPSVGCPGKALCSLDLPRDSTRRGTACENCTPRGLSRCPNGAGTNGFCVNLRGRGPSSGGSECLFGEGGVCGNRCQSGFICCYRGGPTGECVPAVAGQFCPPLPGS